MENGKKNSYVITLEEVHLQLGIIQSKKIKTKNGINGIFLGRITAL